MGLEQIGLEGVFKTEAFASGLSKYTSGMNTAISETGRIGGSIGSLLSAGLMAGVTAFAALSTAAIVAGGAIAGVITKMVFDAATLGDTYAQMSGVTGITTTRLQELAYAGKLLDVDLETITSGLKFLTRNMYAARDGTGTQAEAFATLGIKVKDAKGNLRDADIVFGEVIDKLGKMKNPTEADAIAMALMGRSAMELNPLIKAGSKALAEYSAEAHMMGAVVSEEGIAALDKFNDRMDAFKLSAKAIGATFALNFLPGFQSVLDDVQMFGSELSLIIGTPNQSPQEMAKRLTVWLKDIMAAMTKSIPKLSKNIGAMVTGFTKIIMTNAPTLIKAGGELLVALLKGIASNVSQMIMAGVLITQTLWTSLKAAWPSILDAGKELIHQIGRGIMGALSTLPTFSEIVNWIFQTAVDLTGQFKTWFGNIKWGEVSQSIIDAINGIKWDEKGTQLRTAATNLGTALMNAINEIKWSEIGGSVGTGFSDFVIGLLSPGQNLDTLRATWQTSLDLVATTITTYGWNAVGQQISTMIGAGLTSGWNDFMGFKGPFRKTIDDWWVGIGGSWRDVDFWGSFFGGAQEFFAWQGPLYAPVSNWWASIGGMWKDVDWGAVGASIMSGIWDGIMAFINWKGPLSNYISGWWNGIGGAWGIPAPGANWGPPSEGKSGGGDTGVGTGLGVKGVGSNLPTGGVNNVGFLTGSGIVGRPGSSSNVSYNVVVNNPTAEPASTSVDRTLRKLSYLGAV